MKVYVRAPYEEACLAELKEIFDEVVYEPWTATGQRYYEDEMLEHLLQVQPDALITELDRVTEKVLAGYDRLKFIGDCRGTPANLQVDACTKAGVPILCTPGRNTQAVAEMVVGLILTMYRKTIPAIQWVKDGKWVQGTTPYYLWMGNELQGKKVMVFSAIGNPSSFEQTLACIGIDIIEAIRYPDHHDYGMLEMQYISERAISKEVVAMVTTGKDAVKIPTEFIYFNREMPLYILNMDIKITEGREVFEKTILNAIQKETNE